jgi:hypothetical protein
MTDTAMNGKHYPELHDLAQLADTDDTRTESVRVRETAIPSITPFGQPSHDQLQYTVDRIAADWSAELAQIRENSEELEQQMLECTAKVKSDLTLLFLLGNAVRAEVQRGKEVNAKLVGELSKIVAEAHA